MTDDLTYRRLAITALAGEGVGTNDDGEEELDSGAPLPEEVAIEAEVTRMKAADTLKTSTREQKYIGININGVMCSATSEDQNGLVAVYLDYMNDQANFPDTLFEFVNGSEILITQANIAQIKADWTAFRRGFFSG